MSISKWGYSGRSYGNFSSNLSPVEEGEEYEADITELSRRGDGIARIQGYVVFVSNVKVGDYVKFKITRIGRTWATAEVI
jgi:predicted RNA-binding protein with TRAM domain